MNRLEQVRRTLSLERFALIYARIALGAAFLSAVASRFGFYKGKIGMGNFSNFIEYTAEVNSFMPVATIPYLAWVATIVEITLGVSLIFGVSRKWVGMGAAVLLALFGAAMAISFGIKSPLDYSVFSASAGALLLSLYKPCEATTDSQP